MKPPLITRKGWNEFHFPRWPKFDAWLTKNEWGVLVGVLLMLIPTIVLLVVLKKAGVW